MYAANGVRPDKLVTDNGPAPDEAFYAAVDQWRTSPLFSDRERTAIEFAERFAEEPKAIADDEDFWQRARLCEIWQPFTPQERELFVSLLRKVLEVMPE